MGSQINENSVARFPVEGAVKLVFYSTKTNVMDYQ
jgi:hypothetical protein